jgi:hypothetical protein
MYAKVFSQIYDGTLCTNGPWEALVTFQQMLVLADQEGNVDMTAAAISRRTTIPIEIIEKGLAVLLEPDPESRTPTEEGKRIIPLVAGRSWGWKVVNYLHYRAVKNEEDRREYHRKYWHKRKEKLNTLNTLNNSTVELNDSTHTEAYTNTEEEKKEKKRVAFAPPSLEEVNSFIQEKGYSVNASQFVDFYQSKGWMVGKTKMRDWKAGVRLWQNRNCEENKQQLKPRKELQND